MTPGITVTNGAAQRKAYGVTVLVKGFSKVQKPFPVAWHSAVTGFLEPTLAVYQSITGAANWNGNPVIHFRAVAVSIAHVFKTAKRVR